MKAHVRYGPSRYLTREEELPEWLPDGANTLVGLGLGAGSIEFLLQYLPQDDGFTKGLRELRDIAKDELWAREAL
jgi:hypothetical protein